MKKIILRTNPKRDEGLEVTKQVADLLESLGAEYEICAIPEKLGDKLEDAEMVITFGGDGTILHAARETALYDVPILGVNMGNKGFMAELEKDEIELISKAITEGYRIRERMMLDVALIRNGEKILSNFALNDVVVGGIAKMVDLSVYSDGRRITSFSGDGLVVATPIGSTAYSMAAGGPIVEPGAKNIIVTPICAHILRAVPFVLDSSRQVAVEIGEVKPDSAYISSDGEPYFILCSGDRVEISKSESVTKFVNITGSNFYDKVSIKLGERR